MKRQEAEVGPEALFQTSVGLEQGFQTNPQLSKGLVLDLRESRRAFVAHCSNIVMHFSTGTYSTQLAKVALNGN